MRTNTNRPEERVSVRHVIVICGFLLSVFWVAGCGGTSTDKVVGTVNITVTYGGEPVTECSVEMVVVGEGKGAAGDLDDDGTVSISDVEVGNYTVTIRPPAPLDPDPEKPLVPPKEFPNVPEKFRIEATTPLKADVKQGGNEFKFELKDG